MAIADISRLLDLTAIQAEHGKRSLKRFTKDVWHIVEPGVPFVDGWCLDAIIEHLEAVTHGDLRKIVINIPPRHTKSTIISVIWPVWDWLHKPDARFLCASYKFSLALRDNKRKRNLLEEPFFQKRYSDIFQLSGDQKAKSFFENNHKGYQLATSVAGSATGDGGSRLVIDDAHSADDAYSDTLRETAVTWFREVWSNRLNDQNKDAMVVVGQRIHSHDVCGYILSERPDWTHLNLPAEYEPARKCTTSIGWQDPRTVEGELLWPERFNHEVLDGLKRDLGSTGYAAQYQQSPVPASGGMFKSAWIRRYSAQADYYELETEHGIKRIERSVCRVIVTGDLAISQKQEADFTVFSVWAVTPDKDVLLLDVVRGHFDNPEQQKQIRFIHQRWHPVYFLIEAVAYQLALIQQVRRDGIPVREFKPVKDKVSRAITASVMYEASKMFHPHTAPWLVDAEQELLTFPKGSHDDFVDTDSMIAEDLFARKTASGHVEWAKQYEAMQNGGEAA